jgi:hypothetical protein
MQKLPVILCIKHALSAVFNFREMGLRVALPWVLTLAAMSALDLLFFGGADFSANSPAGAASLRPADFIIPVVSMVSVASIAVNWHRYILHDEATPANRIFRLDAVVWKYLGRTLLIMLAGIAPVLGLGVLVMQAIPQMISLLAIPLFIAAVYIMRMSVALPAIALDRSDFGIRQALQLTQGNDLQMAGLLLLNALIILGLVVSLGILLSIAAGFGEAAVKTSAVLLSIPANVFFSLFSISLISSLYGFFAEKRKF